MEKELQSLVLGNAENRLVSEKEAAQIMCVSVAWLRRARLQNEPPDYIKIGRHVRYETRVLKDFLQARRVRTKEVLGKQ